MEQIDTTPKQFCFVLMPFSEEFNNTYQLGIADAFKEAGAYCERVDEQLFTGSILDRIYNQISKCDFIIADMSGRNPNVFYEVGYAHALGKSTILLTQNADDIPFDMKHFPHIVYSKNEIKKLKDELVRRINWFIEHPDRKKGDENIGIELLVDNNKLSAHLITKILDDTSAFTLDIDFHNASSKTFIENSYQIGIISNNIYLDSNNTLMETPTIFKDGKRLFIYRFAPKLFPDIQLTIQFHFSKIKDVVLTNEIITFRLFTDSGFRDFPLQLIEKEPETGHKTH
jgi:hypothetical protein